MSWHYLDTEIVFLWLLGGISPRKELWKYMKIFQFNHSRFTKFLFYNIHSERIKRIRMNLLMKQEIHAAPVQIALFIDKNYNRKIWGNGTTLRNGLHSTISVKYFTVTWPDSGTRIWVFLYNVNTQEPL